MQGTLKFIIIFYIIYILGGGRERELSSALKLMLISGQCRNIFKWAEGIIALNFKIHELPGENY